MIMVLIHTNFELDKNPLSILLADQFYTLLHRVLELLNILGFSEVFNDSKLFARETISIFQRKKQN